jgi:hypothetical protein
MTRDPRAARVVGENEKKHARTYTKAANSGAREEYLVGE